MTTALREDLTSRSALLAGAYSPALRAHAGQRQDADRSPHIEHALDAADMPDEVVTAGLLHEAPLELLERQDPAPPFLDRLEDELRRLRRA